eukprot:SAG22_NODE_994_length_6119_cov_167.397674_5_plen_72_part_00
MVQGDRASYGPATQSFKDLSFIGHGGAGSVAELEAAAAKAKETVTAEAEAEAETAEEPVGSNFPAPALAKL